MGISLNTQRLIECRKRIGITKMEAAKRMHLSQPAYLRYESGTRTPSLQTLTVIANVLDTSVEYLTGQSDDFHPVSYTVSKSTDPELFEIIKLCKSTDHKITLRMIAYANKICSTHQSDI